MKPNQKKKEKVWGHPKTDTNIKTIIHKGFCKNDEKNEMKEKTPLRQFLQNCAQRKWSIKEKKLSNHYQDARQQIWREIAWKRCYTTNNRLPNQQVKKWQRKKIHTRLKPTEVKWQKTEKPYSGHPTKTNRKKKNIQQMQSFKRIWRKCQEPFK